MCFRRQRRDELRRETHPDCARPRREACEQSVVISAAPTQPESIGGEGEAGHEDEIDICEIDRWKRVEFRAIGVPNAPIQQLFLQDPNGITIELNYLGAETAKARSLPI